MAKEKADSKAAAPSPAAAIPVPGGIIAAYKELAERNPKDRYVIHGLLMAFLSQKAYQDGIREFLKLCAADQHNDQAWMGLAVLYEKGGYDNEAIRSYLKVMELNPDEELVYPFLSARYLIRSEWDHAVSVCLSGIERFPRAERLHFNLGVAYAYKRMFDKALESFQKEIEISPQCTEAYSNIEIVKKNQVSTLKMKAP